MLGSFATVRTCDACHGTGKVIKEPCQTCKGKGRVTRERKVVVNIPAGVDTGTTLTVRGEGEAGMRGGPNGDLYVKINVKPHKLFVRKGYDIHLGMNISFTTAVLGGEIEVPTLSGTAKLTIPEGTQPGTVFRIKGAGIPYLRGTGKGDLYVTAKVEVPRKLTEKQKELLRQFEGVSTGNEYQEKKNFFERLKDAFDR